MQERLERICRQLEGLLVERERLHQEIDRLRSRLAETESAHKTLEMEYNSLQETNKMLKLAKVLQPEGSDRKEIKLKINELVREIDRCIDILST
jgi:hypothetical protein